MKRLRDQQGVDDEVVARAAALLRAEVPIAESDPRRQRVRAAMRRRQEGTGRGAWRRWLVPAAAVAVVVLLVAGASARIGRWARSGIAEHTGAGALPEPRPAATTTLPAQTPPPTSPTPRDTAPADTTDVTAPPAPAPIRPRPVRTNPRGAAHGSAVGEIPGIERASREEVELVFEATDALLNAGDAGRAGVLLATYLSKFPHGAIHEYALHLAVRAAAKRGAPEARDLAERYLRQYRRGSFREEAERVARVADGDRVGAP